MRARWKSFFVFLLVCFLASPSHAQNQEAFKARSEGYQAQQEGDLKTAIKLYKRAIKADRSFAAPYNDLGVIYEKQGKKKKAERQYLKAIKIDENSLSAYTNLASLYEETGNYETAMKYWNERVKRGTEGDTWTEKARARANDLKAKIQTEKQAEEYKESLSKAKKKVKPEMKPDTSRAEAKARREAKAKAKEEARAKARAEAKAKETAKLQAQEARREARRAAVREVQVRSSREAKIEELIREAKLLSRKHLYDQAFENLNEAQSLGASENRINEITDEIRTKSIDFELGRAVSKTSVYKKAKLIEVENAWYPPKPEPDAGKVRDDVLAGLVTKSPGRLRLEKKAHQIVPAIDFSDARLQDVIEFLALSNDINIVIDEQVVDDSAGVTIHLKNIPLIEALDIILRTKGLKHRFENNIIWITTEEKLAEEDLVIRVYDVQDLIGKLHDFPSTPFDISSTLSTEQDNEGGESS